MDILDLSNIMIHFTPCAFLLCAALLFVRRHSGDKSRLMLAVSLFVWGFCMMGSIVYHYSDTRLGPSEVLSIYSLVICLITFHMMNLYSSEVIMPNKLNTINIAVLITSVSTILIIIAVTRPVFIKLHSFDDIVAHIGEYNVWLRVIIALYFIPLALTIFIFPYKHTKSRVNLHWIRLFSAGLMTGTCLYVIWIMTNSDGVRVLMQLYYFTYCIVVTYQELYHHLPVTKPNPEYTSISHISINTNCISPIWTRTIKVMEQGHVWRNPDLTLIELASLVGTNRTTLSNLIREAGYDGFYSLINTCRIKEFIEIITNNEIASIQETFYSVGFRSKSTAIRYFRQETGTTPTEYLQKKIIEAK